jgi:hypothetical protein
VAVPCRGDHDRAMAGDEEMILTLPMRRVEDLMVGLRCIGQPAPRDLTDLILLIFSVGQGDSLTDITRCMIFLGTTNGTWVVRVFLFRYFSPSLM